MTENINSRDNEGKGGVCAQNTRKMGAIVEWPAKRDGSGNPFFEDIAGNIETFKSNAHRMFKKGDATDIYACNVKSSECMPERIRCVEALQLYLNGVKNLGTTSNDAVERSTHLFLVNQSHSRGPMQLSEDAMKLLLCRLQVFPGFIGILAGFKLHTKELFGGAISCSGIYSSDWEQRLGHSVFETAYILKHVENNGRDARNPTVVPWSIRQMAVYQQYNANQKSGNCILVQTSSRVKSRIGENVKDGSVIELTNHWTFLHELYLGTVNNDWENYLVHIQGRVSSINDEYLFTSVEAGTKRVTFLTLRELSVLRDQLAMIGHALEFNLEILKQLSQEATRRASIEGSQLTDRYQQFQANLRTCVMGQTFIKQQATHAGQNADRLAVHLRDTIALQDSNVMMALNHKTIREAQTMRTITLVALVYLPASFTATFLAMGYVHVESLSGVMKINVAPEMWFYLAITAPLMVITFLAWGMWEWRTRRRVRGRSEEDGDEEEGQGEKFKIKNV